MLDDGGGGSVELHGEFEGRVEVENVVEGETPAEEFLRGGDGGPGEIRVTVEGRRLVWVLPVTKAPRVVECDP